MAREPPGRRAVEALTHPLRRPTTRRPPDLVEMESFVMWIFASLIAAADGPEPKEIALDFESTVEGELVRPDGEILFASLPLPASDRSASWRRRRASALDRQLPSITDPTMLAAAWEERGDLHAIAGREQRYAAWVEWDRAFAQGTPPPPPDHTAADHETRQGAIAYGLALPALSGSDAARVAMKRGAALVEVGQHDDAAAAFRAALAADPAGPTAPDAHIRIADRAFDTLDLDVAANHYRGVTGPLAPYASYKLAWVLYNTGDAARASQALLSLSGADGTLRHEASKDLVRFLADGQVPEALDGIDAFCEADSPCLAELRDRLRGILDEQGRSADAATVPP